MYWNQGYTITWKELSAININMRCIEIWQEERDQSPCEWLTLTWDVLKYFAELPDLIPDDD